jgi:hypothetical protein
VIVRSELFVSTRAKARRFGRRLDAAASPDYVRASGCGLAPLELEPLWAILLDEPLDPARHRLENLRFGAPPTTALGRIRRRLLVLRAALGSVLGGESTQSGLYRFPTSFVRALALLDEGSLSARAAAWAATSAMAAHPTVDAHETLRALRRLALEAQQTRRGLFLWGTTLYAPPVDSPAEAPVTRG